MCAGHTPLLSLYADFMIPRRLLAFTLLLTFAATLSSSHICAQANFAEKVTITPEVAEVGSPELIRVSISDARGVSGEWLGRKLEFFQGRDRTSWYALAGLDVEASVGQSKLKIDVEHGDGVSHIELPIEIHSAEYRTESLSVAPRFVEPSPQELKRIEAEVQLKAKVFSVSAQKPLWRGDFSAPVTSASIDNFGERRMFNGALASIHKGLDFRARRGTPVRAANSGVVVLARRLYYEGNCVIIDHGLGLYTVSMHLSRISVHTGQHVATGQKLGLSGATGRVTGPHLHWAVRWGGAYLDPAKLLKMDLSGVR